MRNHLRLFKSEIQQAYYFYWHVLFSHLTRKHVSFLSRLTKSANKPFSGMLSESTAVVKTQILKHNKRNERTEQQQQLLRALTGRRQDSRLFTSAAEKLNQRLPQTTSTSGQNGS